ncbi:MAG: hypothetical protein U0M22_05980, partial [Acutalibacteraceae bacterium]|nr:hypothetical protein [Acutalibacteraceae bacterium]
VAVTIHGCPPSARFLPDFCCFPCTYYTTYGLLCLEIQGLFHYSVDINYIYFSRSCQPCPENALKSHFERLPDSKTPDNRSSTAIFKETR